MFSLCSKFYEPMFWELKIISVLFFLLPFLFSGSQVLFGVLFQRKGGGVLGWGVVWGSFYLVTNGQVFNPY